jgi:hypothetical protein
MEQENEEKTLEKSYTLKERLYESKCYKCSKELEAKMVKKRRPRMCNNCKNEYRKRDTVDTPIALITTRFKSMLARNSIQVNDNIVAMAERVWNRWNGKCVLTGQDDYKKLCIASFRTLKAGPAPPENEWVIVTSSEAMSLSKCKNNEVREARFPPEIRARIVLAEN